MNTCRGSTKQLDKKDYFAQFILVTVVQAFQKVNHTIHIQESFRNDGQQKWPKQSCDLNLHSWSIPEIETIASVCIAAPSLTSEYDITEKAFKTKNLQARGYQLF